MMRRFLLLSFLIVGCGSDPTPPRLALTEAQARPLTDRTFEATPARLDRGEYLVEGLLRCLTCHSERDWDAPGAPPIEATKGAGARVQVDSARWLTAPNLTPDRRTGIGRWTDDMLARAIREGVGHDGRVLHRMMEYSSFRRLSDEDLASVVVYLRSLPPVRNALPPNALPMDEQERLAEDLRPLTEAVPEPDLADPVERGRYLVQVANCAGCHTSWHSPRNPGLLGGGNRIERERQGAFSANITVHPTGLYYGANAFATVMRTGKGGTLAPMMPWTAYARLTDEDLAAIHAFLATMRPVAHAINNLAPPTWCTVCEQEHGLGEQNEIEVPEGVPIDLALLDDYVGTYRSVDYGFTLRVTRDGDGALRAQEEDGPVADLIPQSDTRFLMAGGLAPLRFERDASGAVTHVVSEEVEPLVFQRVTPAP